MKVLVTGSRGQLGRALQKVCFNHSVELIFTDRDTLNVEKKEDWRTVLNEHLPNVIINTAGYTAVEQAEMHVEEAYRLNKEAAAIGASAAREVKAVFIHISTDYVFDGHQRDPYTEDVITMPLSVYGKSKRAGEEAVLEAHPGAWVIRVSWLYSEFGKNFMTTMMQRFARNEDVKVVNDQWSVPTCALTFADHLLSFVQIPIASSGGGILHYSLEGEATWCELAQAIRDKVGSESQVVPISTQDYPTLAKRPQYSKLNNTRFRALTGLVMPEWKQALNACLNE